MATPMLTDPNFHQTVVLVCEHGSEGALGLVLNRPTDAAVVEHLPEWAEAAAEPEVVFVGGPVQPEVAVGLGACGEEGGLPGWQPVAPGLGLLDLAQPAELVAPYVDGLRIYSGYAGWGGGQLEAELDNADWFVLAMEGGDPFRADADELWRTVLRRQKSNLSWYASYPPDPSLN